MTWLLYVYSGAGFITAIVMDGELKEVGGTIPERWAFFPVCIAIWPVWFTKWIFS